MMQLPLFAEELESTQRVLHRVRGLKTRLTDNSYQVLIDGEVVFEYMHPDPRQLYGEIGLGEMRPGPTIGFEVRVSWGQDSWAWCDADRQFTRIVHNSSEGKGVEA